MPRRPLLFLGGAVFLDARVFRLNFRPDLFASLVEADPGSRIGQRDIGDCRSGLRGGFFERKVEAFGSTSGYGVSAEGSFAVSVYEAP